MKNLLFFAFIAMFSFNLNALGMAEEVVLKTDC